MIEIPVTFYGFNQVRLSGVLCQPEDRPGTSAVVVLCHGLSGVKHQAVALAGDWFAHHLDTP